MPDKVKINASIEKNESYMNHILPMQASFDLIQRDMMIGGKKGLLLFC